MIDFGAQLGHGAAFLRPKNPGADPVEIAMNGIALGHEAPGFCPVKGGDR